jgi:hypothetical protein
MNTSRKFSLVAFAIAILIFSSVNASAKDDWIQVKTKNFLLVGNAPEKDIRRVATKLEQFRETFRQIFGGMKLTSPIANQRHSI